LKRHRPSQPQVRNATLINPNALAKDLEDGMGEQKGWKGKKLTCQKKSPLWVSHEGGRLNSKKKQKKRLSAAFYATLPEES